MIRVKRNGALERIGRLDVAVADSRRIPATKLEQSFDSVRLRELFIEFQSPAERLTIAPMSSSW